MVVRSDDLPWTTPDRSLEPAASCEVAIIGGGPAGLMAAEAASAAGARVCVFDRMASVGRKFLLAGKGGLNLTHAEPLEKFLTRFDAPELTPLVRQFDANAIRAWALELGIPSVVGSSSRVFPADYQAAPLLRRWLQRLRRQGVRFAMHYHWQGWRADGALLFTTPAGELVVPASAVVLALGGASWPRLGADGSWVATLAHQGIPVTPLAPANCGFEVAWTPHLQTRFAGAPVKSVRAWASGCAPQAGEFVVTEYGLEGGLIYALSALLRKEIKRAGNALLRLDLTPGLSLEQLVRGLSQPQGARTLATHLKRRAHLEGVKAALLHEFCPRADLQDPARLAQAIKALPIPLSAPRPLAEAISTAGGVSFSALDQQLMVVARPGLFVAGEMLDWEAPTGGYLLSACLASGRQAGHAAGAWVRR